MTTTGDEMQTLDTEHIRMDGGTQPRAELDQFVVDDYAEAMRNGAVFPPVTVFYDGTVYWLADGFHRVTAAKQAGVAVRCDVQQGTRRDAVLHSVGANADHGLRRTNADKRRAVLTLLRDDEWHKWSDYEIAGKCNVSQPFVLKLRKTLTNNVISEKTYVTKHGTVATMNTANIGKADPLPEPVRDVLRDADVPKPVLRVLADVPPEAQAEIAQVVATYGVEEPETVRDLARIHKSQKRPGSNGTFDSVLRSGYIQPGEEGDAVHIAAPNSDVKRALYTASGNHRALMVLQSLSSEWYTPASYIDAARVVMGGIDVDPASCEHAQQTVRATRYYTRSTNGLVQKWHGRVWLNPPYGGESAKFVAKLMEEYEEARVEQAVVLVNANSLETQWFAPLWRFMLCFTDHRINFMTDSGERSGSTHSSVFVYIGENKRGFFDTFRAFGNVVQRVAWYGA